MSGVRQRKQVAHSSYHSNKPSTMMRGTRLFRGGIFMDLALLAVFIILAYVFIVRRSNVATPDLTSGKSSVSSSSDDTQHLIDARMKKSPDYRSAECKNHQYTMTEQVSIIVTFFDYSFHDLKTTVSSILHHTPMDMVKEILIIDDASSLEYIVDKSKAYVQTIDKARLIRNKQQLSVGGSRMVGVKEAVSNTVVFLDTNVVVAKGWLDPLVDLLKQEPTVIAVPHYDAINDPVSYEYKATKDGLTASMSWSLAVRMTQAAESSNTSPTLISPALRGNAMAVNKKKFLELGGYDEGLLDGGGHNLELSLRAWLCGSKVLIAPCSRVGIVNLQDPVKIVHHDNIRRIAELWFSGRKNLVFRNTGIKDTMIKIEQESFQKRRAFLDTLHLQCKDIEWFFENVAGHLPTPSEKAMHFGMLKCRTGRCARVGDDKRIDLGKCSAEYYHITQTRMMFEFTEDSTMISGGACLTVQQSAYITLEDCIPNDGKQKWQYKEGRLKNEWSQYCMMHVTDPDKATGGKRQIGMAQECSTASEDQFVKFDFITM